MKLLLTSSGLTNKSIVQGLQNLANKPFQDLAVVFIPTAANGFGEDKGWLLTEMQEIYSLNFKKFDIVDIAALPVEQAKKRLTNVDIIVFSGGDTFPLMEVIQNKNLKGTLATLFENKIYIGISAGSMITAPQMLYKIDVGLYDEGEYLDEVGPGLEYVPFHVKPHFLSSSFPKITKQHVEKVQEEVNAPIYLLDDQSALKVDGNSIEIISEGTWGKIG